MSPEVEPRFKTPCPCGSPRCDKTGAPVSKLGHVRGCKCFSCVGRRNNVSGKKAERTVRKALGIPTSRLGEFGEERWADNVFANEVKSGKQVGPVSNWWRKVEAQVLANRVDHGDRRLPVRAIAMPEGWKDDGLVVVLLSTWETLVRPALEEFYGPEKRS